MTRLDSRKRQPNATGGRSVRRVVKLTVEQDLALQVMAKEIDISVPRLLVESTLAQSRGETAAERRELITALFMVQRSVAAVGNNLNQIARAANATGEVDASLGAVIEHISGSMKNLDEAIASLSFKDVS